MCEEDKDMMTTATKRTTGKPIPKTQVGLNRKQKDIMKSFVGKSPKLPVELNKVRDWEKYGEDRF
ncbi:hypothetical protein D1872_291510 [compost metagenome]